MMQLPPRRLPTNYPLMNMNMNSKRIITRPTARALLVLALVMAAFTTRAAAQDAGAGVKALSARPNIVLILADDLGWSDLGCYGADLHETPHLDRLARQSIRFTDAYAMSVCTPTRAALLTGKHAARLQMTIWSEGSLKGPQNRTLLQADSRHNLPRTETTLAKHLQGAGYLTAQVGKWHLGDADHYPETHGFDVGIGGTHWGAPQTFFWPYRGTGRFGPEFRYVPHLEFGQPGEYLTDRLTVEALRVIERAGAQPFFLYLAHHAPHTPIEAKPDDVSHFEQKLRPGLKHQNATYAAMVKSLDDSVGRVLARLEQRGLANNTIVIFTSDNGGFIGKDKGAGPPVTNNAPLRSGKGSLYEGGIRVPLLIRWPGVTPAGVVCSEPVILMDLFHTLRAVITPDGGAPGSPHASDGVDLRALLKSPTTKLDRDALFFHYPHYYETTTPVGAIRAGDWKLLEYFEDDRVELFNLREDFTEKRDLARENPDQAAQLRVRLRAWRESVGAAMPKPNPGLKPK
ncbi:MAG: sulfatase [Blastocatellia bacterium]